MSVKEILDNVGNMLTDVKSAEYGSPEEAFQRIATYWTTYLDHKGMLNAKSPLGITCNDVAMMMVLFKVAREEFVHKPDNLYDIIGYATLAEVMAENKGE